ncbi:MAG TPA: CsgG/HfaB family protein [Tepidisphaeraceae bacterium]|nr:CsgG/HfaB family protein [Tepidisphaeraceae bacterium]
MSFATRRLRASAVTVVAAAVALVAAGCTSSSETAKRDVLTENVGQYDPAPSGVNRPRVGVPPFNVKTAGNLGSGSDLNDLAADQMSTLLDNSERFRVIERTQLDKLLDEQNLEGIVRPGEMAKPGQVRGVDYLLLGKVTNLRVKAEKTEKGFGIAQLGGLVQAGGFDFNKKETKLTTEAGVDIRMVDPTTGETLWSNFSEYNKTDTVGSTGIKVLGAGADSAADLNVDEDSKGKILRLALDDALRKSMPKIDKFLRSDENKPSGSDAVKPAARVTPAAAPAAAPAAVAAPNASVAPAAAAKMFCPACGKQLAAGAKFCPEDGTKIE